MKSKTVTCLGALSFMIAACGGGGSKTDGGTSAGGGTTGAGSTENVGAGGSTGLSGGGAGGTCRSVAACGGDVDGTWELRSVCLSGDMAAGLNARMGTLFPASCENILSDVSIDMTGTVTFAGGTLTSHTNSTTKFKMHFGPACASALTGTTVSTMSESMCDTMKSEMEDSENAVTCSVKAGSCDCDIVQVSEGNDEELYAISGTQLVDPAGEGDPMDFCVAGTTLNLTQTSSDMPGVTMVLTLRRQ